MDADGCLRHAGFTGIRTDKDPESFSTFWASSSRADTIANWWCFALALQPWIPAAAIADFFLL